MAKSKLPNVRRRDWWSLSRSDRRIMLRFYGFLFNEGQRRALEARLTAETIRG